MKSTIMHCIGLTGLALAAGCSLGGEAQRVEVERNDLGVTTIEVDQFAENGNDVFELRGFSAGEKQLASIRMRSGTDIGEFAQWLRPGAEQGTEIKVAIGSVDQHIVTEEQQLFLIDGFGFQDSAAQEFVELAPVASALEHVNVFFDRTKPATAGDEAPFVEQTCAGSQMLTSPVAKQCCYGHTDYASIPTLQRSHHVNPNGNIGLRNFNTVNSASCKASNGTGSCSGASCYYGPFGFARPVAYVIPAGKYAFIQYGYGAGSVSHCNHYYYQDTPVTNPWFPDVTGYLATGQGCPGGNMGAGQFDY